LSQYYFTVASLPLLTLEDERPMSPDRFLSMCSESISARDLERLAAARAAYQAAHEPASSATGDAVVDGYIGRERSLRVELARLRAPQVGWGGEELAAYAPDPHAAVIAREAMNQDSPLAAETALDQARWRLLDDLEVGHYFDIGKLVIYLFRLLILARRTTIDTERGVARFDQIYSAVTEGRVRAHTEMLDDDR